MYLFILESIGTQELLLIGAVALIFLGPRKLPQIARTIGKTLKDFRSATNDFKETWEREVNFEEEMKSFKLDDDTTEPLPRDSSPTVPPPRGITALPEIKEIDKESFDISLVKPEIENPLETVHAQPPGSSELDKRNWL